MSLLPYIIYSSYYTKSILQALFTPRPFEHYLFKLVSGVQTAYILTNSTQCGVLLFARPQSSNGTEFADGCSCAQYSIQSKMSTQNLISNLRGIAK